MMKPISVKILTFLFVLVSGMVYAQNIIVTFKPNATDGKDAYLSSFGPNVNYGTHLELSGDAWTCNSQPCFGRGLIEFDLSSIPPGSIIHSASLTLHANPTPQNGGGIAMQGQNSAILQRVTSDWDEMTVTWDTPPSTVSQNEVTLPQSTLPYEDYIGIDVSLMVQDMVNDPYNSFGFMLRLVNEVYYSSMIFASSDYADSTLWPELRIDYTPAQSTCMDFYMGEGTGMDAFLASSEPLRNFVSHPELSGEAWTCASLPCFGRGVFYFDLSQIPQNAIVQSAKLSLFANPAPANGGGISMQGANEAEILRVTSAWDENTVTWSTAPTTSNIGRVVLPQSSSPFQDYPNIDIGAMVQDLVANPSDNYGFMLKLVNEVAYASMIFASSDYPDPLKSPVLEVCYYSPTGIRSIAKSEGEINVYPNPFNDGFQIEFDLKTNSDVNLEIYDMSGRLVFTKLFNKLNPGKHVESIRLNSNDIANGIYLLNVDGTNLHTRTKLIRY